MPSRSYKKIGAGLLIVLCLLILIIGGVVYFVTGDRLKSMANTRGSAMTGRDFSIDGDVDIRWNWRTPRIIVNDIRLANSPESKDPDMVKIGQIDATLEIWNILRGRLVLPELNLTDATIILEKTDEDTKNWDLPAFSEGGQVADAALPDSRRNFPVIGRLVVKDGVVIYRDVEKDLDVELGVNIAHGEGGEDGGSLSLRGDGSLQKQKFELRADGGPIDFLRDSHKPYPLDLFLKMGPTEIVFQGTMTDPVQLAGIDATLKVKGNNMADLFYLTGIPLAPTPPYSLEGHLAKDEKIWSYKEFQGRVGDSDLSGDMVYDVSGERGVMTAELVSKLLDMDDLSGFIGAAPAIKQGETAAPEQMQLAQEQAASPRLLPDMKINLDRLRAIDMQVKLVATRIDAPGWPISDMNVTLGLEDGVLRLDPLKFGVSDGSIDGILQLDGRQKTPDVEADLALRRLSLKRFFEGTSFESMSDGRFGGRINLKGQGKSLAEVLAVSDGRISVTMSGGQISLTLIEAAGIDIAELAPLLFGSDQTTRIRCAVGDFKVNDGILTSDIFVFDTTDSNLQGDAVIDLREETINAIIHTSPKDQSILALKTPVTVSGKLKSPSIGLEPLELGARGVGAAVLGALFPPAAIIPFIELGLGEDSDCRELIAIARQHDGEAAQ